MIASRKPESSPYQTALGMLAGRDYTAAGLTRKLVIRGISREAAAEAVERLAEEGFLNDRRYAERIITVSAQSGQYVGYRLGQELRRRGVPKEIIEELVTSQPDQAEHSIALARELTARRYPGFTPATADVRERRRVAGFLQRRGFSNDLIRQLLYAATDSEHL